MALIHHRPPPSWLPIDEVFVAYVGGNHDHFANIGSELMEHGLFFLEDRLANLTMPVLLLWGDDDRVMDFSCINKYIDQVPDLQYRLYPNVGHVIWADAPGRTLRDMRRFLSRHRSGIKPLPTSGVRPASG
jgi:pimeloyl-ACP methyl ester carboxylesterase